MTKFKAFWLCYNDAEHHILGVWDFWHKGQPNPTYKTYSPARRD